MHDMNEGRDPYRIETDAGVAQQRPGGPAFAYMTHEPLPPASCNTDVGALPLERLR